MSSALALDSTSLYDAVVHTLRGRDPQEGAARERTDLPVRFRRDGSWGCLDVQVIGDIADYRYLLRLNAVLPGPAKFCLSPAGEVRLRAELPCEEDGPTDLHDGRVGMATAHMHHAHALVCSYDGKDVPAEHAASTDMHPAISRCGAQGWKCIERGPNHWMVELDGTRTYAQAEIKAKGEELELSTILGQHEPVDEICDAALLHWLLSAGGVFRMVRTALVDGNGLVNAELLLRIPAVGAIPDLEFGLSALSVAMRHMQHEFGALCQPEIAGAYLAMHHAAKVRPGRERDESRHD